MNKILLSIALSLVAFTASAGGGPRSGGASSSNSVSFDANSGRGFVAARVLAGLDPSAVTFSYQLVTSYSAECTWNDKTRTRYPFTQSEGYTVNSNAAINGSRHLYSGVKLTGFGTYVLSGDQVPTLGAICQKGQGGTWTSIDIMGSNGGLYMNYGTSSTLLQ